MTDQQLVGALLRLKVETGSLACAGCGHEHNCSLQGCNILREAVAAIQEGMWRSPDREIPEEGILVLVIVNGVCGNTTFVDAVSLAAYSREEGWILDEYPEWENPGISFWAPIRKAPVLLPLPEPPEELNQKNPTPQKGDCDGIHKSSGKS